MQIMKRRVLEQNDTGWHLETAHDDFHRRPAPRKVSLKVRKFTRDVLVAAQCIEVELLVVVERSIVAQPLPDRVGVIVDVEVKRIIVQINSIRVGHCPVLLVDINSFNAFPSPSPAAPLARAASGNTISPTRSRYGHARSGGRPPHSGDRLSISPAETRSTASATPMMRCDLEVARSSATSAAGEIPAEVSLSGFHSAYIRAS